MNNAAINVHVHKSLCEHMTSFLLHRYLVLRNGIAGSYGKLMLNILRNWQTVFQSDCTILHFHQQCVWGLQFLHICTVTCYFLSILSYSYANGYEVVSYCGFNLLFPLMANEHLLMCFLAICLSSFMR